MVFLRQFILNPRDVRFESRLAEASQLDVVQYGYRSIRIPRSDWIGEELTTRSTGTITRSVTFTRGYDGNGLPIRRTATVSLLRWNILTQEATGTSQAERYVWEENDLLWRVDFFKDHRDRTIFILAETHVSQDILPSDIPEIIQQEIVYRVTPGDDRFNRLFLTNSEAARSLITDLLFVIQN